MPRTPLVGARIAPELMRAARARFGDPDMPSSDVVRRCIAEVVGVDVATYTPRMGRPPKRRAGTA